MNTNGRPITPELKRAMSHFLSDGSDPFWIGHEVIAYNGIAALLAHGYQKGDFRHGISMNAELRRVRGKAVEPRAWTVVDMQRLVKAWPRDLKGKRSKDTDTNVDIRIGRELVVMRLEQVERMMKACMSLGVDRVTIERATGKSGKGLWCRLTSNIHVMLMPVMWSHFLNERTLKAKLQ